MIVVTNIDNFKTRVFETLEAYKYWCERQVEKGMNPDELIGNQVHRVNCSEEINEDNLLDVHDFHCGLYLNQVQNNTNCTADDVGNLPTFKSWVHVLEEAYGKDAVYALEKAYGEGAVECLQKKYPKGINIEDSIKCQKKMKTLIIYNDYLDVEKYLVLEGDYSRFHGIAINTGKTTKYEDEFCGWFYDTETGHIKHPVSEDVALLENKEWDKIAIVSFIP